MRLAFIGTQSTGKTTVLDRLTEVLPNVYAIREVARTIIRNGFPLGKNANVDSHCLYMATQLQRELAYDPTLATHLVSDRCVLDLLAHARINRTLPRPFIPDYVIELIERVTILSCRRYDLFFYFPVEFTQHNDCVREEDEDYRIRVGDEILRISQELDLPTERLTGTVETRLQTVLQVMNHDAQT
jgi:AAA domain